MMILLLTENFPPKVGGSSRWFWEIYRRMSQEETFIIAGEHPMQDEFDETHKLRLRRIPLTFQNWGIFSFDGLNCYIKTFFKVKRIINQQKIDFIHCGKSFPEGLIALCMNKLFGIPYLYYVQGEEINTISTSRELTWLSKQISKNASCIITCSNNTSSILQNKWKLRKNKIRIWYPGVDTKCFKPSFRSSEIRNQLGWGERPVILTVGRLQKRKGHDHMILALQEIRQSIPNVLYVIVGDGDELPFLEELVESENLGENVQFLGELNDEKFIHCYQQCDLFVLPNREVKGDFEGFGMVLLEAQACGKPVIAGVSGGTSETMRIPETGLVVNCEDPHQIALAIINLLKDKQRLEAMGRMARQWVMERFDWTVLLQRAEKIFNHSRITK